jgi:hypothetical protein
MRRVRRVVVVALGGLLFEYLITGTTAAFSGSLPLGNCFPQEFLIRDLVTGESLP